MSLCQLESTCYFEKDYYVINYQRHSNLLLNNLNNLRKNSHKFTDVSLCVENVEYPCHRSVLAASSEYFLAMFSSNLSESHQHKIYIKDISSQTIGIVLDYIYTGSLKISYENIQDLFTAASLMHYPLILENCCNFFIKYLDWTNCLGIEEFARLHGQHDLEKSANNYTLKNFNKVIFSDEFFQLNIDRLLGYISNLSIFVPNEETVLEAVYNWIEFDSTNRFIFLEKLLKHIRLTVIEPNLLNSFFKRPLFLNSKNLLSTTDIFTSLSNQMFLEVRPSTLPREVLASFNLQSEQGLHLDIFDSLMNAWTPIGLCPTPSTDFSATVVENNILVTGGSRGLLITREAWWFDGLHLKWSRLSDICESRSNHASIAVGWHAFIFGGTSTPFVKNSATIRTIECIDLSCISKEGLGSMPQWSNICYATFPRVGSQIAYHGNVLHEVGGTQYGVAVKKMNNYHLTYLLEKHESNIRMDEARTNGLLGKELNMSLNEDSEPGEQLVLPETIEHAAIVSLNNIFYIVALDSKKFISLDPKRRIFRILPPTLYSHIQGSMVVFGGVIHLVGGREGVSEYFDLNKNVWVSTERFSKMENSVTALSLFMKC